MLHARSKGSQTVILFTETFDSQMYLELAGIAFVFLTASGVQGPRNSFGDLVQTREPNGRI